MLYKQYQKKNNSSLGSGQMQSLRNGKMEKYLGDTKSRKKAGGVEPSKERTLCKRAARKKGDRIWSKV